MLNRFYIMSLLLLFLLTSVFTAGCINQNITEVQKPKTEMEKLMNRIGLKDLVWLRIEKDGPMEGFYQQFRMESSYPVIIDAAYYKNRECLIIVYTWEVNGVIESYGKVESLGHIYIVAIDINSNKKIIEDSLWVKWIDEKSRCLYNIYFF